MYDVVQGPARIHDLLLSEADTLLYDAGVSGKEETMDREQPTTFDMAEFIRAFEANEIDKVLEFYAGEVEHIEIDADGPPKGPRTSGRDHLVEALKGGAEAGIKLRMENPVIGQDRAACTITCILPDGRRLISNTIYELRNGLIVRQLDVQVMDPEEA